MHNKRSHEGLHNKKERVQGIRWGREKNKRRVARHRWPGEITFDERERGAAGIIHLDKNHPDMEQRSTVTGASLDLNIKVPMTFACQPYLPRSEEGNSSSPRCPWR